MTDARPDAPVMPAASPLGAPPAGSGSTLQPPAAASAAIPSAWQPIKTAPRETELLVGRFVNDEWRICQSGFYFDEGNDREGEPAYWYWHCDWDSGGVTNNEGPTHWMPLPEPPREGSLPDRAETEGLGSEGLEPGPKDAPKRQEGAAPAEGVQPVAWLYESEGFADAFSKRRLPMDCLLGAPKETALYAAPVDVVDALRIAEAALADIGDADRELGDDVAWCERRAAEALPAVRAALSRPQAKQEPT